MVVGGGVQSTAVILLRTAGNDWESGCIKYFFIAPAAGWDLDERMPADVDGCASSSTLRFRVLTLCMRFIMFMQSFRWTARTLQHRATQSAFCWMSLFLPQEMFPYTILLEVLRTLPFKLSISLFVSLSQSVRNSVYNGYSKWWLMSAEWLVYAVS